LKKSKNISLDTNILQKAETKAKERGFDFSNYINYLINNDLDNCKSVQIEPKKEENEQKVKNEKVLTSIDEIIGT
jgi:macrodomain Ter protein organizer (MatP/YcbG family)